MPLPTVRVLTRFCRGGRHRFCYPEITTNSGVRVACTCACHNQADAPDDFLEMQFEDSVSLSVNCDDTPDHPADLPGDYDPLNSYDEPVWD